MSVQVKHPGVYIEEVPSGVRTIVGVATSITAFVGRTLRGSIDEPIMVYNWGEFERLCGGLALDYPLSYAVRDFFLNGGTQAVIARLFHRSDKKGHASAAHGDLHLEATSPGEWGNKLTLEVDYDGIDAAQVGQAAHKALYERFGLNPNGADVLFNLTIKDEGAKTTERFANVTFQDIGRRFDRVLKQESSLARLKGDPPAADTNRPGETVDPVAFGSGADSERADPDPTKNGEPLYSDAQHSREKKTGLYLLEKTDLFNILCIPPDARDGFVPPSFWSTAMTYCVERRAMLIVDPQYAWGGSDVIGTEQGIAWLGQLALAGTAARNAALYFPRVKQSDPMRDGQTDTFVPCGIMAGVWARTDSRRGVWKAPAGIDDGALNGTQALQTNLTDDQNGALNPLGINCLRSFPVVGRVAWGARTLRGADQLADEYKYVPIRRLALFIEESLFRGTQWVVFEPNDEPLWAQIRLNVGAFMHGLFRQGAFQGSSPKDAYFVKCDAETNPQSDIDKGIVNIHVGFAPLKPAEFVIIKIQQIAGQLEV
jgi:hypothetical protein